MRAAVLHRAGTPPEPGSWPEPVAGAAESLLAVEAAPISPLDLLLTSGTSYFGSPPVPSVPGVQGVGRVLASGSLPAGCRVWFQAPARSAPALGALAERTVAADELLVPVPEGLPGIQAAALGLSAVAAWGALLGAGRLAPGERVLVLGASGTVGSLALQLARWNGAGLVVGAARRAGFAGSARADGAERTVDLREHPDPEALRQAFLAASPDGYDLVVDPLCGPPADAALVTLRPGGRLVNLGSAAGPALQAPSTVLRSRSLSVLGYTNASLTPAETTATLAKVFELAAGGVLRVRTETHALEQVTAAWQRADGQAPGRVVVLVDSAAS